jgi:8-oxo-dGTP pyrophosphatase MutT (NUDIX family)
MKQGVRVSVLVVNADRLLLVREVDPRTHEEYWVPPGGGIEEADPTIFLGAQREVLEEAGVVVDIGPLIYLREFRESLRDTRWLELYFLGNEHGTAEPNRHAEVAPELWREAHWFTRGELADVVVYPEILRNDFWDHIPDGFDGVRYLGSEAG